MRSSPRRAALALVLGLPACGMNPASDPSQQVDDVTCQETGYLDYETFGQPFMENWCRGCHSSSLPADMRQQAPATVNFDTVDDVRTWTHQIAARAGSTPATMPPAGGPSADERQLLVDWLGCGAK